MNELRSGHGASAVPLEVRKGAVPAHYQGMRERVQC
jgi:hypothetical protein